MSVLRVQVQQVRVSPCLCPFGLPDVKLALWLDRCVLGLCRGCQGGHERRGKPCQGRWPALRGNCRRQRLGLLQSRRQGAQSLSPMALVVGEYRTLPAFRKSSLSSACYFQGARAAKTSLGEKEQQFLNALAVCSRQLCSMLESSPSQSLRLTLFVVPVLLL